MTNSDYQHFVCIVAGDNPEELLKKYDKNKQVDEYIVYKFEDRCKLKDNYVLMLTELAKNRELSKLEKKEIEYALKDINDEHPDDFFFEYTEAYKHNEETGDAVSTENPDGKWSSYQIGKVFSVPFMLKDGREQFHGKKKEIAWDLIHKNGEEVYRRTWEICMEGDKPKNETEQLYWENMHDKTTYLNKFETKENYVDSSTSFWGYAFLSKETGWVELESNMNQFEWVRAFYDRFIVPLDDETELTIIECRR